MKSLNDVTSQEMNMFDMISAMNSIFGNPTLDITTEHKFNLAKPKLVNQTKNIKDEIEELEEAYHNNDYVEMVDAMGDILTFAVGLDHFLGGMLDTSSFSYVKDDFNLQPSINIISESYDVIIDDIENTNFNNIGVFVQRIASEMYRLMYFTIAFVYDSVDNESLDFIEVLREVTSSNISKVCVTDEDMHDTVNYYSDLGVETYTLEMAHDGLEYYVVYSSKEQFDVNGKVYRRDKFLKSYNGFFEPNLEKFVSSN